MNHGTRSNPDCDCEPCQKARRDYQREWARERRHSGYTLKARGAGADCKRVRTLSGEVLVRAGRDWGAA